MSAALQATLLLIVSNSFMTYAFLIFVPLYMRAPLSLDSLWTSLCILGAVFFIFRSSWLGVPGG